jgi:hypothetical protein
MRTYRFLVLVLPRGAAPPPGAGGFPPRSGEALYDERIRALVETPENIGKLVAIDVETGDYNVGDDTVSATQRLLDTRPGAVLFGIRIGYNAVYALGGALRRTVPE